VTVPEDTPFASVLRDRLAAHQVARVHLGHGASAVDLVELLRTLAGKPAQSDPARSVAGRLTRAHVVSIGIVSLSDAERATAHGARRITEALGVVEQPAPRSRPTPSEPLAHQRPAAELARAQRSLKGSLAGAVEELRGVSDAQLLSRLDTVQSAIVRAIGANELSQALEALLRLIRQEVESPSSDVQRQYGIALRRLLAGDHLRKFAPMVVDDVYHEDIALLMRRAGKQGTKVLLDLLIEAPSQAERLAYLKALRQTEEGADVIASLLNHHEWYVVRNAADLVGEMRIGEAVPMLARVAGHEEPRVRRAVGLALAQIGTADTALALRKLVIDADTNVRMAVVKAVGGRALSGLAMPLVSAASAEEDPVVLAEYYRALGRIGTPDAVAALVKAAKEGGKLLARRASGPRLAAIEGLGQAGGATAVATLRELAESRSGDVRTAATAALERARASGA
jgi:HEAT repeat protein